jgi:hypothetical protein
LSRLFLCWYQWICGNLWVIPSLSIGGFHASAVILQSPFQLNQMQCKDRCGYF